MRKNSFGQNLLAVFVVIGIMAVIGAIDEASEPRCIKTGCDNKQAPNSSYCYLHKPYTGSSSSHSSSSYSGGTKSNSNKSNSKKSSSYKSYDDGYDDIYMDGDYDDKRYKTDKDYADGVDDAMDEFDEDW